MHSRFRPLPGALRAFFLTIAITAPAFAAQVPPDALPHVALRLTQHQPLRIIAFGSSSTQGVGASSPAASYPSRLQEDLLALLPDRQRVEVLNRGIGGQDADDMAKRLPAIIAEQPDLIIWQTGSNDELRGVPIGRFIEETVAGVRAIRAAHIDVMLMEPQLCKALDARAESTAYRNVLRSIGEDMNVPLIRRHELMREWLATGALTPSQLLSPDGLHMADAGYAKLADFIAKDIVRRAWPALLAGASNRE
jgi:lysophospholipase L1-like esterase